MRVEGWGLRVKGRGLRIECQGLIIKGLPFYCHFLVEAWVLGYTRHHKFVLLLFFVFFLGGPWLLLNNTNTVGWLFLLDWIAFAYKISYVIIYFFLAINFVVIYMQKLPQMWYHFNWSVVKAQIDAWGRITIALTKAVVRAAKKKKKGTKAAAKIASEIQSAIVTFVNYHTAILMHMCGCVCALWILITK